MPAGRPTSYKPEYVEQAKKLCILGATDAQMADFFGVDVRTIGNWKVQHEEFFQALKTGKESADAQVVRSLFQRAIGYEVDSVKIFMPKDATEPVYAPFRENIQPDTTACIFWLKNRMKDEWRDRQEVEHSVDASLAERLRSARERRSNAGK